jgi:photosystem II stability/assembly factor-like uncharacterized protein
VLLAPSPPITLPADALISAPSRDVVWVLINGTYLYRSTDRGTTWQQRPAVPHSGGGGPPEVSFVDDHQGWAFFGGVPETQCNGDTAEIWRTTDAGATWQRVAHILPGSAGYAQCKEGLSFIDPMHGFLGADDPNRPPTIYRTSDGGLTWSGSTLPDPPGFVTQGAGITLRAGLVKGFNDTLLLQAWGSQASTDYVFRSTDGGASWKYLSHAAGANGITTITFVTATRWLQIGNDGSGLETTDAGQTWHAYRCDYQDAAGVASLLVFGDSQVGYGTVRGGIHRTVDGGLHWVMIKTPGAYQPG